MPKRSRQAHIPPQQIRRRKARREPSLPNMPEPAVLADEPIFVAPTAQAPVATRSRRRLASLETSSEPVVHGRALAGQLPTFDRAYMVRELRTISITSGVLLAVIVALTLILR